MVVQVGMNLNARAFDGDGGIGARGTGRPLATQDTVLEESYA